ncbi:MAG: hypothetical protein A3J67_00895 [Parcubacteria group bacterium RIFCSPHIGHO2_02_FULL_48_10b]|nr:MAG: hypothetical protein A3J67_00895 [Parcubacteria group bacterium RIFCSPHIGHO2_02_FULL_48_10b]
MEIPEFKSTQEDPERVIEKNRLRTALEYLAKIWDEYGWPILGFLETIRPLHAWALGKFSKLEEGEKVLEIGSGYPLYNLYADRVGERGAFISLDINKNIQARSKKLLFWFQRLFGNDTKPRLLTGDASALPFTESTFDALIASNFTGDESWMDEALRVLKPGGRLITSWFELGGIPLVTSFDKHKLQRRGFTSVKQSMGAPGIVGINWYVEAIKPIEQETTDDQRVVRIDDNTGGEI